jgi:hypothetical protein
MTVDAVGTLSAIVAVAAIIQRVSIDAVRTLHTPLTANAKSDSTAICALSGVTTVVNVFAVEYAE